MGDDPILISSGVAVTPESVTSRTFSAAFRGYHPAEVRQFLKLVSDEMAARAGREAELRRALEEAEARASHPQLDEATLTGVLGDHAARLIATARETSESITTEARRQSEAMIAEAEARSARLYQEAEGVLARRVAEADAATEGAQQSAGAELQVLRAQAESEAQAVIDTAQARGREMVTEARVLRERMLEDLARRRRAAQVQIEQLRAARDRLLAAHDVVRRTLDEATAELSAAEPEAFMAAEAVARRAEELENLHGGGSQTHPAVPQAAGARPPVPSADRPPMRPQTVAALAGRPPAPPSIESSSPAPTPKPSPAPTPKPSPAPTPSPTPTPTPTPSPTPTKVEELFTRLRAERRHATPPEAGTPPKPEPRLPARTVPSAGSDPVVAEMALEGRDDLLDNIEAGLTRALKRVLQNEQNTVLDGLRRLGAAESALPSLAVHLAMYREAALPWLQQAARAGVLYASDRASEPGEVSPPAVESVAEALCGGLVQPLRDRLLRAVAGPGEGEVGDPAAVGESLRSIYRQWKVQELKECARHHTVVAFAAGAFAATAENALLCWVVDDGGPCPDCDDNALAGPTPKGQPFPTGQRHPPAHRGCRCLLVPATT